MKTVRFAALIEASGAPQIHLAWAGPKDDSVLQKALRQHRVLTVHQRVRGAKKDFGVVGFEAAPGTQYLIFPRSIRKFSGQRVVGIRYDLVADALPVAPSPRGPKKNSRVPSPKAADVIAFPVSKEETKPKHPSARPEPKPAKTAHRSEAAELAESDPIKREIRKAVADLSKGRVAAAKRRLLAVLE